MKQQSNKMVCEGAQYRHYKGGLYVAKFVGIHSETLDRLVVYQSCGGGKHWIRPLNMFTENVVVDNVEVPRFALVVPSREEGA